MLEFRARLVGVALILQGGVDNIIVMDYYFLELPISIVGIIKLFSSLKIFSTDTVLS